MKSFRVLSIAAAIIFTAGCSFTDQRYADNTSNPTPGDYGNPDVVATQGIGNEVGFENMQQANANGGQQYAAKESPKNNVFYFSYDDTRLRGSDIRFIEQQSKYLMKHANAQIFLGGHADERGSREYNIGLGERRAKRVAEVLQLSGVPRRQIRIVSYGREKPQIIGHSESAWRMNRRVEFVYESLG